MTYTPTRSRHPALAVLLNLVGQLLLLTAIPLALWKLYGNPIPKRIPSWEQIQFDWRGIQAQPSQLAWPILTVIADILWIVWAWYAISLAFKLLWILIRLPHAILTGTLSSISPALAFRALSLSALATHPPTPVHTANAATAPATPTPIHPAPTDPRPQAAGTATTVDVVEPGDNLWDLAEHYYHHGEDWHEIYDANQGAAQPDGQHLQNPDLIQPGWHLVIPTIPAPGTGAPNPAANGAGPADPAPHGPATAPPTPNRAPGRPAPAPAHTAPHTAPARQPGGAARPAPERPHTVGYALPEDAGYIGITLITSIAAAVAILRARNRRRGLPREHEVPDLAGHLAAVHSAAVSADHYGYRPDEHPGQTPPPLLTDPPSRPVLGTSQNPQRETALDLDRLPGPLVLTGPGAHDAARALAINTLASQGRTLHTDPELTSELLGTPGAPDQPGWLTTTEPEPDTGEHTEQPATTHIRAPRTGIDYPPGTVLLGRPEQAQDATVLDLDADGTLRAASGTDEADRYTGTRLHTLTRDAAAELYTALHETHPAPTEPPDAQAEDAAPNEAGDPAPGEHAAASNSNADPRALTTTPLILRLLGDPDILGPSGTTTPIASEQATSLLTILALHPDGIRTRELRALEWPNTTDGRPSRTTSSRAITRIRERLHKALTTTTETGDPVQFDNTSQTYRLNPAVVTTDLALIQHLTQHAETAEHEQKLTLLTQAASLYRGPLASSLDDHRRDWLTTARYTALNDAAALHLRIADLAADTEPATAAHHIRQLADIAPEDRDTVTTGLKICQRLKDPKLASHLYQRHRNALHATNDKPDPAVTQLARAVRG